MKSLLTLFSLLFLSLSIFADETVPEKPVETSLQVFQHEERTIFALSYKNAPHWHTYWKNPGDAGLPTEIKPENFKIKEYTWPIPQRFIEKGDILAYGYDGSYTRFFEISSSQGQNLKLSSNWLVCKHICIPGKVEITATFDGEKLTNVTPKDFNLENEELIKRLNALPKKVAWPDDLDIVLKKDREENRLIAYYNFANPGGKSLTRPLGMLTPFRQELLDIQREKLYKNAKGSLFGKMSIAWDGEYMDPVVPFPSNGQFEKPVTLSFLWQNPVSEEVSVIEKSFTSFDLKGADDLEGLMAAMTFVKPISASEKGDSGEEGSEPKDSSTPVSTSFFSMLLFAFVGGLILNVMPCVLPVISLKLFGLVVHSDESRASILRHNIFYTLGVLSTFLILSLSVLALKSTGENVGWGFQLQSPVFVSIMIAVLFVFALNLFGLYEFQTPGGKVLGDVQIKKGNAGDFFSGVLATVLSTPCSAPFLGTALTFAFTSSSLEILLIFQAIGVGLAFPFLMTGIFPATIKFLPKPGMWMEAVKKFLGLTLLLTALWLVDVFISLTNGNLPLMKLNTGLLMLFFAFYFQKHISKKKAWRIAYFIIALIPFYMLYSAPMSAPANANGNGGGDLIREKNASGKILWEKWSEKRMAEYQQAGETVFLDFTAKWCFTCKVNEKLVLDTKGFKELVEEKNVKLLLGDWTKYDPVIGAFLKKNGFVGVPAYFIQKPDGTLIKLGETITLSKIREHL